MGDRAAAAPVSDAPTQQQVSTSDSAGSSGRTASTTRGAKALHSSPAQGAEALLRGVGKLPCRKLHAASQPIRRTPAEALLLRKGRQGVGRL